ncbi:WXG100 family type VII secretion target [Lentzea chajnantorensis]
MSSYHGIAGDVEEFAGATDANDLISGEPAEITESATAMRELGEAMTLAGEGLTAIDSSGWTGQAADGFRSRIAGKPKQWMDAGAALLEISKALTNYRVVLDSSKDTAGRALHMWKGAQEATKKAITEHNERVKVYNGAIDAGQDPGPQPVYQDPGEAGRKEAERMLEDARRRVTDAGYACGRVISEWIGKAPAQPDWWDRLGANISDAASYALTGAQDVAEGIWEGVKGINSMMRLTNPFDPYNISHPGAQLENMNKLASGLWNGVQHPTEFAKTVFDVETWKDSPGKALGKLLPDIALGVATGGGGFAGRTAAKSTAAAALDTASGGLFGLGQAGVGGVRKVGSMLGRDANKIGHAAEDAGRAGRNVPHEPAHPNTTPVAQADSHSAGMFDQIGKSLGDVGGDLRSRIDDLAAWATSKSPDSTTVSSVTPTPQPPVRQPPQVNRPTPQQPAQPRPAVPPPAPVAPPPALRPVQPPPERPPPPFDSPERNRYDIGERIQQSIQDTHKFKEEMRNGFPNGNGVPKGDGMPNGNIAERLTPDPHQATRPDQEPPAHPKDPDHDQPTHQHEPEQQAEPEHQQPEPEYRSPLADDPAVRADIDHSAAVKDLDLSTIHEDAVWRDTTEDLHRVDARDLDELFEEGLLPRNENLGEIRKMIDENAESAWVSTTRDEKLWENHAISGLGDKDTFSVLTLGARGGVDVEASFPYTHYMKEQEIAFPGGVDRSRIRGGYLVRINPDGSREIVPGSWRDNPYYEP